MKDILIVVDMQNDFIDGTLGTIEAQNIVSRVVDKVSKFDGTVLFTRDTHEQTYLQTQEGRNLPIMHCVKGTAGWQIHPALEQLRKEPAVDKVTFGSVELGHRLQRENEREEIRSITLVGLCTDICVISNAMLIKAFLPETPIAVDASCCAGVTPQSHQTALQAMKACQIEILNEQ